MLVQREAANMRFLTSGSEKVRIDSTGNVGIGTTSPTHTLNVQGTANITGDLFLPTQSLGGCSGKLITSADGNITCGTDQTGGMDYTNVAMTNKSNTFDGTVTATSFSGAGTGLSGTANSLSIGGNAATAAALASNPSDCSAVQYARGITASGAAEGCTTVPDQTGGMDYTNVAMKNESNTFTPNQTFSDSIFVTNSVGIGTSTPSYRLDVTGGPINAGGGLIIETRTSDPGSPVTGQIWLRTDL